MTGDEKEIYREALLDYVGAMLRAHGLSDYEQGWIYEAFDALRRLGHRCVPPPRPKDLIREYEIYFADEMEQRAKATG